MVSLLTRVRERHYANNNITEHDLLEGVIYACLDLSKEWAEIAIEENPDEKDPLILLRWVMTECHGTENPQKVSEHLKSMLERNIH
jgi:hypothetical protein